MCSCNLGAPAFTYAHHPLARRAHRCCECRSTIQPGERYVRLSIGADGTVDTFKICLACDAWGEALEEAQERECGCSGWEMGRMWAAIREFSSEHLQEAA